MLEHLNQSNRDDSICVPPKSRNFISVEVTICQIRQMDEWTDSNAF